LIEVKEDELDMLTSSKNKFEFRLESVFASNIRLTVDPE